MKTIIVEDEENVKISLENKLQQNCKNVDIIAWANTVESAISVISKLKPELVLLDIKLHDGTAFDLLQKLGKVDFKIIFTTAYNDYAIDAFKFSALDYLMKPIRISDLTKAINKAEQLIKYKDIEQKLETLYNNLKTITN